MMLKLNKDLGQTLILIVFIVVLSFVNIQQTSPLEIWGPENIILNLDTKTIDLSSMTLRQKIAQMVVAYGKEENLDEIQTMLIGGIYLDSEPSKEEYVKKINKFQENSRVPLFVTVDLEGCWNPFRNFIEFPTFKDIQTEEQAYNLGKDHGKVLKETGFNLNFAPVVDLDDTIWKCRAFPGNPEEIASKSNSYIAGLQEEGILATSKHYPGKTLVIMDPHKFLTYASINDEDLIPFEENIRNNVSAIMISHIIASGSKDSKSRPSVVSEELVKSLRDKFSGLIITDEIRMLGLKSYYSNVNDMYIDLFKADNDLILNFDTDIKNIYNMINVVERAVKNGEISEERIDNSVRRILNMKGFNVV